MSVLRATTFGLMAGLLMWPASSAWAGEALLHPMFQDHAVLQRGQPIPVYGQAAPGGIVTVTLGSAAAQATADAEGHWRAILPAMGAGGPYDLSARTGDGAGDVAHDVLVGDVFLCGGQSNMQLPVKATRDAAGEIRAATDSQIRFMTVATHASDTPLTVFADAVAWTVESPQTIGDASASCVYFARELKKTQNVPIGLVVAPWGGTRERNWISEPGLRHAGLQTADLDMLDLRRTDPQAADRRWDATWEAWWRQDKAAGEPWRPDFSVAGWKTAPQKLGPWALWEGTSPDGFVGQMWMRTHVHLTTAQAAQSATLELGGVNEEDETWINGQGVGGTSGDPHGLHPIPAGVLKAGDNTIVTNIFCSWRFCGLNGPAESRAIRLSDGSSVGLDQPWRYAEVPGDRIAPQLPWGPTHGDSQDYNGMIAPIGPYAFRAVIWYQGESDVHFTGEYQALLGALVTDWRDRFGADLPFLIVELPNFGVRPTAPMASAFADIREAQRRVASSTPKAGYIVTIDIGEADNIHPADKQAVGRRLALAAQRVIYGQPGPAWGAAPGQPYRQGRSVIVPFANVTTGLAAYSGAPNAFELCGPDQASCRYVTAQIVDAHTVRLDADDRPAVRVRYCWGDSPTCTLTDGSGLPATPFEVPIGDIR
jgi:sialate O-acetylesterase